MLTRQIASLALTAIVLVCLADRASAQEFKIKSLRIASDGQLVWHAGETISKQGVSVQFESHMEDGKFAGYKLANADNDKWKSGDKILLYVRGIKFGGPFGNSRDSSGARVFGDEAGGFRVVTLDSIKRVGARVTIAFLEEVELQNGQKVKQLEFPVVEGFLIPTAPSPAAKAPAEKKQ